MSGDACDGMDAFKHVLEELCEAQRNMGDMRGERDRAKEAQRHAEQSVASLRETIKRYRTQGEENDFVHRVIKDAREALHVGKDASPELLARLAKAIEKTEPIPF